MGCCPVIPVIIDNTGKGYEQLSPWNYLREALLSQALARFMAELRLEEKRTVGWDDRVSVSNDRVYAAGA